MKWELYSSPWNDGDYSAWEVGFWAEAEVPRPRLRRPEDRCYSETEVLEWDPSEVQSTPIQPDQFDKCHSRWGRHLQGLSTEATTSETASNLDLSSPLPFNLSKAYKLSLSLFATFALCRTVKRDLE